jgi:hypothetical protein
VGPARRRPGRVRGGRRDPHLPPLGPAPTRPACGWTASGRPRSS